ncbi:MAG: pentapeptide repeat-containing protein [Nodosilinea sp. WJT8-NPBG4]|jgi:uncharacterized protein YjbI with pentapeptide repeats|nr:pentapeptide repeat-containing protein [Nodosilinea sp. WJT8-NPBG4]
MANEEQVALLKQGYEVWNAWRNENLETEIDLGNADLCKANLFKANLKFANLESANLESANLESAILSFATLSKAILSFANLESSSLNDTNFESANLNNADLSRSDLRSAYLRSAYLRSANLSEADLSFADLIGSDLKLANLSDANLSKADLSFANLTSTSLSDANLRSSNLRSVNLRSANLNGAQVLNADFTKATLTGACIADWQIGRSTRLEEVKCDYIFHTYKYKKFQFAGRLPVDPESTFAPGEFTQLFQVIASALETIPITFTEGIDWQAFFKAFQDLRDSRPNEDISIQGMERKGNAFIVRLEVEAEADKAAIETEVKQRYAHQLAALEAQYGERLRLQGAHLEDAQRTIAAGRQRNTELIGVIGIVAQNQGSKYDMRGSNFGQFVDTAQSGSRVQSIQHIYAPEQQDLGEAAQEIQKLLNTLAETYNTTTDAGKEQLMKQLGKEVEKHPKWRRALKVGGIELIKVLCAPIGVPLEMARVYLENKE